MRTVHCSICRARIRGYNFATRMKKLRRHRKRKHPRAFRASVRKGVRTRKRKR